MIKITIEEQKAFQNGLVIGLKKSSSMLHYNNNSLAVTQRNITILEPISIELNSDMYNWVELVGTKNTALCYNSSTTDLKYQLKYQGDGNYNTWVYENLYSYYKIEYVSTNTTTNKLIAGGYGSIPTNSDETADVLTKFNTSNSITNGYTEYISMSDAEKYLVLNCSSHSGASVIKVYGLTNRSDN